VEIMALMRDLGREHGIPVIVNMHDVELAKRFADRIVGMAGGKHRLRRPAGLTDDAMLTTIYGGAGWLDAVTPLQPCRRPNRARPSARLAGARAAGCCWRCTWSTLVGRLDFSWERFVTGLDNGAKFLARMFPPRIAQPDSLVKGLPNPRDRGAGVVRWASCWRCRSACWRRAT
jgi:energy-coupling factor transporter ATP-binding protein EcfA2